MTTLAAQEREANLRLQALQQKLLEDFQRTAKTTSEKAKKSLEDDLAKTLEKVLLSQLRGLGKAGQAEGGVEGLFSSLVAAAGTGLVKNNRGVSSETAALEAGNSVLQGLLGQVFGNTGTGQTLGLSRAQRAAESLQFLQGGQKNL